MTVKKTSALITICWDNPEVQAGLRMAPILDALIAEELSASERRNQHC